MSLDDEPKKKRKHSVVREYEKPKFDAPQKSHQHLLEAVKLRADMEAHPLGGEKMKVPVLAFTTTLQQMKYLIDKAVIADDPAMYETLITSQSSGCFDRQRLGLPAFWAQLIKQHGQDISFFSKSQKQWFIVRVWEFRDLQNARAFTYMCVPAKRQRFVVN